MNYRLYICEFTIWHVSFCLFASQDYYKVTGKHYFRKLPDADIRLIAAGIVLFLSVLLPFVQYQRYMTAIKYLTTATLNNFSLRNGGSKQTAELFQRASTAYETMKKNGKDKYTPVDSFEGFGVTSE